MKLKRGPKGLFSTYFTLDGYFEFVFDDTQKGGSLPPRGQWLVYNRRCVPANDEPMYFGASLTRGFATLREAKEALTRWLHFK